MRKAQRMKMALRHEEPDRVPEAMRLFFARVDMMVQDYNSPLFGGGP